LSLNVSIGRPWRFVILFGVAALVFGVVPSQAEAAQPSRQATVADPEAIELALAPYVEGFDEPLRVTNAGDGSGRLFVVEKRGVIHVIEDDAVHDAPFLDISERVRDADFEQGLFSVAFHPDYADNGTFFVVYTAEPDGANVLARFQRSESDANVAAPDSELRLFELADGRANHNGGDLAFSPLDGYLYYATGDGGGVGDPDENAQDPQALLGKILRVDVDGGTPYAIPDDNPFVNDDRYRPEIWALGLRNPWRFSFDRATGDLYVGDVGQGHFEELDVQPAESGGGQNYGWPIMEGAHCYPPPTEGCDESGLTLPTIEYPQYDSDDEMIGCSIVAGVVYRGAATPGAGGAFLYGDWCTGRIWLGYQDETGEWASIQLEDTDLEITSIGEDEAGELYLTDMRRGVLYQVKLTVPRTPPVLDSIDPAAIIARAGGVELSVAGSGFTPESVVVVDGVDVATRFVSSRQLVATLTPVTTAGVVDVQVRSASGLLSAALTLTVLDDTAAAGAFQRAWARIDAPVADVVATRTWIWGPEPFSEPMLEPYADTDGGWRIVQYYDKSRMEMPNAGGDPNSPWYVTNGLLVREMMTGELQIGDDAFEQRAPAHINAAGDPDDLDGISYARLAELTREPAVAEGETIVSAIDATGAITEDQALAVHDVTAAELSSETGHRVASVFWEFMRSAGLVVVNGQLVDDALFLNPYYATGLPLTEAHWARIEVGGTERLVLIQAFERRVLTYTPDNPVGWQVEAGNVGRHYFSWRYR
jgi:glucose/arabinose dehydrogenase